jgi:hypothetical protein
LPAVIATHDQYGQCTDDGYNDADQGDLGDHEGDTDADRENETDVEDEDYDDDESATKTSTKNTAARKSQDYAISIAFDLSDSDSQPCDSICSLSQFMNQTFNKSPILVGL